MRTKTRVRVMTSKRQGEFDAALALVKRYNLEDLLSLYIEAKTGSYLHEARIPHGLMAMADLIDQWITNFCMEKK